MKEILVVGGGFAGLGAALNAADETIQHEGDIHITMVSRDEYMTIRPRLYEKNPEWSCTRAGKSGGIASCSAMRRRGGPRGGPAPFMPS